jgi:hypothetical protein
LAFACTVAVALAASSDPVNFYAVLKGATGVTQTGFCIFRYDTTAQSLYTHCEHDVTDVTAAHIHGPTATAADAAATGTADPYLTYTTPTVSIMQTSTLTNAQEAALFDGLSYVNIHTQAVPAGKIRGQIITAGAASYAAEIDTAQAGKTGPATGVAWIVRSADTPAMLTISWLYKDMPGMFSTANITAVHLHGGADATPGQSASPIAALGAGGVLCATGACTPVFKTAAQADLTGDNLNWLNGGTTYLNFHTTLVPGGEMRGQMAKIAPLTKPMRGAASSLSVGVGALAAAVVVAFVAARV